MNRIGVVNKSKTEHTIVSVLLYET